MNIREKLLEEHSRKIRDEIVRYIAHDKKKFAELMDLFFHAEYRINQRAAWPMSSCVQKYPDLIIPYLKPLIQQLTKKGKHDSVKRNTVRILQDIAIPQKFHGRLMKICFDFIQSNETPAAIKAFSLRILENMARTYPEIIRELKLIVQERWDHESAAFRSRGRKILKFFPHQN
ncbi:MAG: hypothetical protein ACHQET_01700 [Chitinophagales bacterium]